jgi:hypothetical protein
MVIKGKFADGSDLLAIPHYARTNRDSAATASPPGGVRGGPRPLSSIVWIKEG